MHTFVSIALALGIAAIIFVPLRYKWGLHQIWIWYSLMIAAGILNALVGPVILHYFNLHNLLLQCICYFGLTIIEIPLSILPFFYRDPQRTPPSAPGQIISPADGKIIYIKKIEKGEIPLSIKLKSKITLQELAGTDLINQGSYLIGISMNFLDVHVNRAPIGGIVRQLVYTPGQFLSLRHEDSVVKNERQSLLIDSGKFQIGIVQISSRLVRRIVSFVKQNDVIEIGQRIGAIRFGSQVDVILPDNAQLQINVKLDDIVRAGTTVLATISI